jgi:hypothetical protein
MDNIKIVRLQSGEDIIADYLEDTEGSTILLTNPMSLMFKRLPTGKAVMLMSPWLPLELVENTSARLFSQDVLTVFEPKAQLIEYYNTTVIEVEQDMYNDDILDEVDDDDITEEDEEAAMLELEEYQQDTKKRTLH